LTDSSVILPLCSLLLSHWYKSFPGCIKREGPTIDSDTAEGFFRKWDTKAIVKPFIENGRWWAVVPRQYRSAKEMLRNEIAQAGIGKNVDISTMEILDHDTTVLQADRKVLCEMLDPTPYWRRK
jgi:tRNA nucleotidyltransferase (CCA-adding enzyme)